MDFFSVLFCSIISSWNQKIWNISTNQTFFFAVVANEDDGQLKFFFTFLFNHHHHHYFSIENWFFFWKKMKHNNNCCVKLKRNFPGKINSVEEKKEKESSTKQKKNLHQLSMFVCHFRWFIYRIDRATDRL